MLSLGTPSLTNKPASDTAAVFTFSTCLDTEGQSTEPFNILVAPEQNPAGYPYFSFGKLSTTVYNPVSVRLE